MALTSTQIGAIGENLLVNAVMKASEGRLSPYQPVADDDGVDVLFFDKLTGGAVAIQLKCRTVALRKRGSDERGEAVHFEVRQATFKEARRAYLVAGLFSSDLSTFECTWLVPLAKLPEISNIKTDKYVIRPSKSLTSADRYVSFRCLTVEELARRILAVCDPAITAA